MIPPPAGGSTRPAPTVPTGRTLGTASDRSGWPAPSEDGHGGALSKSRRAIPPEATLPLWSPSRPRTRPWRQRPMRSRKQPRSAAALRTWPRHPSRAITQPRASQCQPCCAVAGEQGKTLPNKYNSLIDTRLHYLIRSEFWCQRPVRREFW